MPEALKPAGGAAATSTLSSGSTSGSTITGASVRSDCWQTKMEARVSPLENGTATLLLRALRCGVLYY